MASVTLFMVCVTFFMVSVAGFWVDSAAAGGSIILERILRFLVLCVFRTGFNRWFFTVSVTLFYNLRYVFDGFRRWILVDSAAAGGSKILERILRFLVLCVFRNGFRRWLFYGSRRGRKTFFNGFHRWCFYGFRRGKERFLLVSVVGFLWLPAPTGPRLSLRWKP